MIFSWIIVYLSCTGFINVLVYDFVVAFLSFFFPPDITLWVLIHIFDS